MKWCVVSSIFEPLAAVVFGYFFANSLTHFWLGITNAAGALHGSTLPAPPPPPPPSDGDADPQ